MSAVLEPPTDQWLLPVLRDILPQSAIEQVESTVAVSYWRAIVEGGLATDEDLLSELSARTHFRIATDLLVSTEACERVPEKLARKFGVLPLSISQTILDIATANPYDLDCEMTLADNPVGMDGAVVSGAAGVVAPALVDRADRFPAASTALIA